MFIEKEKVFKAIDDLNLSDKEFAEIIGCQRSVFNRKRRGKINWTIQQLEILAKESKKPLSQFVKFDVPYEENNPYILKGEIGEENIILRSIIEFANQEKWKSVMDLAFRLYEELREEEEREKNKKIESAG